MLHNNVERYYFDLLVCLRRSFKSYVNNNKKYPKCTTPWHQHLVGFTKYDVEDNISCNQSQKRTQVQLDTAFIKLSAAYRNPDCKGNNTYM